MRGEAEGGTLRYWSDNARLVLARDTNAQGCWCVRVGGCTRLTQTWWRRWNHRGITKRTVVRRVVLLNKNGRLLWLLHREELQVPDCSRRWTKGCLESVDWTTGLLDWNSVTSLTCSMPV